MGYRKVTDGFHISVVNAVSVYISFAPVVTHSLSVPGPESTVTLSGSQDTAVPSAQKLLTRRGLVFAPGQGRWERHTCLPVPRGTRQRDLPRPRSHRLLSSPKPRARLLEKHLMGKKFRSCESVVKFFLPSKNLTPNQSSIEY